MSSDPEFEKRFSNKIKAVLETQANLQEAIVELIQAAKTREGPGDQGSEQIKKFGEGLDKPVQEGQNQDEKIAALARHGREMKEGVKALLHMPEGHDSDHL